MSTRLSIAQVNALSQAAFVARFGGVFERSPWVAEGAYAKRPFASRTDLHAKMTAVVEAASQERKRELIRAHPELAGKAAIRGELTAESNREQNGAGLNACSSQEFQTLQELNAAYNDKFGFPFILAVKGYRRAEIIDIFSRRLANAPASEQAECLRQIALIAGFRLADLIRDES